MSTFEPPSCPICERDLRKGEMLALLPDKIGSWTLWHLRADEAGTINPVSGTPIMRSVCGRAGYGLIAV